MQLTKPEEFDLKKFIKDNAKMMLIANGEDIRVIEKLIAGEKIGTLFHAHKIKDFHLLDYITTKQYAK